MKKWMQQALMGVLIFVLGTTLTLAQDGESATVVSFVGSYTLWIAIIIGVVTSIATLFYANRLQGGIVGISLLFFGAGMLFVVAGFFIVVVEWTDMATTMIVHDIAFIIGYILMLLGALRLRQIG